MRHRLSLPPPLVRPAPPATFATRTCAAPMPRAQVEVAGADAQAEVGAWLGCKGEGAPHPQPPGSRAVSLTLPCPPRLHRLTPSPFPDLLRLRAAHSPSPSTARGCPLPGLRAGWCTLALRHRGRALLLPPFPGLPASPPPLPAGREVGVRLSGRGREGAHARLLRPQLVQRGGHARRGMRTPVPLPSHSFCKGMGAKRCAHPLPLHGLPFAHHPEGGMSTTPCIVPRAQPLRTPPFGCHPAHTIPHAGWRARSTRMVGHAGVVHAERHTGSCSHTMGEGR